MNGFIEIEPTSGGGKSFVNVKNIAFVDQRENPVIYVNNPEGYITCRDLYTDICCKIKEALKESPSLFCPICQGAPRKFIALNPITADFSGVQVSISPRGELRIRGYDDVKLTCQDFIRIKYCPECGRKLGWI